MHIKFLAASLHEPLYTQENNDHWTLTITANRTFPYLLLLSFFPINENPLY